MIKIYKNKRLLAGQHERKGTSKSAEKERGGKVKSGGKGKGRGRGWGEREA